MAKRQINSRAKGIRGELEFAALLTEAGFDARRGQQHCGGANSPDVICDTLPGFHFEIKLVQAGNPYKWLEQAISEAGDKLPIVAHRKDRKPWMAIVPMEVMIELLRTHQKMMEQA